MIGSDVGGLVGQASGWSSATSPALWQGVQPDWEHVAALLRKRLELMFLGQKRAPSRSELEPFAVHSTLRYCEEVSLAVGRFVEQVW